MTIDKGGGAPRGTSSPMVLLLALVFFCAAACDASNPQASNAGGGSSAPPTVVDLKPMGGSGATGTVTVARDGGGGSEIQLSLEGLPDPERAYIGAIYRGSCPDDQGTIPRERAGYHFVHGDDEAPSDDENVLQTLTSVAPAPNGEGSSVTPLPAPPGRLLSGGPKYVDVHGEDEAIACANLPVANA